MESLTREETLRMLKAMGIELPADTRLSDGVLQTRLRDALDAAQYKDHFQPSLDITALPNWPHRLTTSGGRSVANAFQRGNMDELRQQVEGSFGGDEGTRPFLELRRNILGMANFVDGGLMWWVVKNKTEQTRTIAIRVVSVLEVNTKVPVLVVLYRLFDRSSAAHCAKWKKEQDELDPPTDGKGGLNLMMSPLEYKVLAKLLKNNSALVPDSFELGKRSTEKNFHASVLLPIGPLEYDALARLNSHVGCAVCGKKAPHRCAQCQSVSYCGTDGQRADWAKHKEECNEHSLRDAAWRALTMSSTPMKGMDGMYKSTLNKFSNINLGLSDKTSEISQIDGANAPPNEYGDKLFIVKIQGGLPGMGGPPGHFMIYDRKRTCQCFMLREDDPARFAEFYAEMTGPRSEYGGAKMYRWARRTGPWELTVCLDRVPKPALTRW